MDDARRSSPRCRDGRLYARGACDDKGQFIIHVNAFEAYLKTGGTLPGQRQVPDRRRRRDRLPNLEPFIAAHKDLLACDAVVVSDTAMFDKKTPSIVHGLRGLSYLQVDVRGTARDLHSGTFGGSVINPAFALAHIIAGLKDAKGKVKVPGFYDKVRKLTAERAQGVQEAPPLRRDVEEVDRREGRCSARPATRRSSGSGRGRRSRSTASGAASWAKARRP